MSLRARQGPAGSEDSPRKRLRSSFPFFGLKYYKRQRRREVETATAAVTPVVVRTTMSSIVAPSILIKPTVKLTMFLEISRPRRGNLGIVLIPLVGQ